MTRQCLELFALLLVFLVSNTGNAQAVQLAKFKSGSWGGGVYGDDRTGQFSHCSAATAYQSGITMIVSVSQNWQWSLAFLHNNWTLRPQQQIALNYRFDRAGWQSVTATAMDKNSVFLPMPADGPVVGLFRRSYTMEINDGTQSYFFNLNGTSKLLVDLTQCVKTRIAGTQVQSRQVGLAGGQSEISASTRDVINDPTLKLEGTRVLSNFLIAAKLADTTILGANEVPDSLRFAHAVAKSASSMSFVSVLPPKEAQSPKQIEGAIIGSVSAECNGKFASGSSNETVRGAKMSTGFLACQVDSDTTQIRYVISSRSEGGFYLLGILLNQGDGNPSDSSTEQPLIDDVQLQNAAYIATNE